jgi:polyisoprenoid-binding protein YceI
VRRGRGKYSFAKIAVLRSRQLSLRSAAFLWKNPSRLSNKCESNREGSASMKSKRSVLANGFAARENWSHTNSERDLARARTRELPMVVLSLVAFCTFPSTNHAQVPVYEVTPLESTIKFGVESSVPIKGSFSKWSASLKFSSTDVSSAVLEIEIQADSVETGSGMKNNKLKGKDFFDAKNSPMITFKSTKVVQTGPNTFDVEGDFTIRGVTRSEKLTVTDNGKGTTTGSIDGTMAFDRKDYGMNSNIPFIKIANRVEVNVSLKWKRVSGPPPVFQQ